MNIKRPPKCSDQEYIDILILHIRNLSAISSMGSLYNGLRKQLDALGELLNNPVTISNEGEEQEVDLLSYTSLTKSSDKAFDRVMILIDKMPKMIETMKLLEKELTPDTSAQLGNQNNDAGTFLEKYV
jgi:hypothetical protein